MARSDCGCCPGAGIVGNFSASCPPGCPCHDGEWVFQGEQWVPINIAEVERL